MASSDFASVPESKVDVLVIGAGPAGLMCANALAMAGVNVRIIDKRPNAVAAGQADGIQPRTIEVLQSYGLADRLLREGNQMHMAAFYNPSSSGGIERTGRAPDVTAATARFPFEVTLHQGAIENIFKDSMKAYGCQVDRPLQPVELQISEDVKELLDPDAYPIKVTIYQANSEKLPLTSKIHHGQVTLKRPDDSQAADLAKDEDINTGGPAQPPAGSVNGMEIVRAKYVVGADGAHSWVRKSLGFTMDGEQTDYIWGVVDSVPDTDFPDIRNRCAIHSENGSCMIIPREGDTVRLYVQLSEVELGQSGRLEKSKMGPEQVMEVARKSLAPYNISFPKPIEWWTMYIIGQRVASQFSAHERVFIAGDACHTHSPKAGQGMNASMNDTHNLAWKLALVLRGIAQRSLLKTYEAERRKYAQDLINFDKKFSALFSGKPKSETNLDGVSHEQFLEAFQTFGGFTSGIGIHYQDSAIVDSANQSAAAHLTIGMASSPLDTSDYRPFNIQDLLPADTKFKVLLFPGELKNEKQKFKLQALATELERETGFLKKFTPKHLAASSVFDIITIGTDKKDVCDYTDVPAGLRSHWSKVFIDDISIAGGLGGKTYETYGITQEGAMVVVRPDGYIGMVAAFDGSGGQLNQYFGGFMTDALKAHAFPSWRVRLQSEPQRQTTNDQMSAPRESTDEESALLLETSNGHAQDGDGEGGLFASLAAATHEPMGLLSKILLGVSLFFLLLSSIFIGLFAGAEHKMRSGGGSSATTTVYSTQTSTATYTTTASAPSPTGPNAPEVCLSANCITISAAILNSLDTDVDPCEDFYNYANGGWLKENPLPASKASWGHFRQLAQKNVQVIRDIISRDIPAEASKADVLSLTKLKDMYQSCMDEDALAELGTQPLLDLVHQIRKAYSGHIAQYKFHDEHQTPLSAMERKTSSRLGLTAAVSFLHSRDISVLFGFDIDGDVGVDPDFMTLQFGQAGLGLPAKEYYSEQSVLEVYTKTVAAVLEALDPDSSFSSHPGHGRRPHIFWPPVSWPPWGGDDPPKENKTTKATRLADSVIKFEQELAKAHLDLDILFQDPFFTYNPLSFDDFSGRLPEIDFSAYLSSFTPRSFPQKVIVSYPPYLKSLSALIKDTNAETMEAYFVSRAALTFANYLSPQTEVWQAKRELDELLKGLKKGAVDPRDEFCLAEVESALGFAAGRFFVEETFGGQSHIKAAKVIDDTITAFKESLPHLKWMDETSAEAASQKATAIRVKVGYPFYPNTTSDRSIAGYYATVHPDPKRFFDNMISATTSEEIKKWLKLGRMRNPEEWLMFPSTIVFPAGILRPPFFSQDWPTYLSYGAFGAVAAHELTHAFDSAGRMYNQRGKLEEWWTNSTSEAFEVRKNCLAEQYSQYTVSDGKGGVLHVNGNLTSGENIGDAGLIYAYHAWQKQEAEALVLGSDYALPGLQAFTRKQLFFLSMARIWAMNMQTAAEIQQVRSNPHSPNKYRVMGTLSNIPEFAKAFNCSAHAKGLLHIPPHSSYISFENSHSTHPIIPMQFTISYRGSARSITIDSQTPFITLQSDIEALTSVPPELQKLLYRGKRPAPPTKDASEVTVEDVGLKDGARVTLMGSTLEEISGMKNTEDEKHRRDEILRRRQAAGPSKLASTSRGSSSNLQYRFHRIEPLAHLPNPEAARDLLQKLSNDPAIRHVMEKHRFAVGLLTELAPHEHPQLLGLNENAGQAIKLRLRTDAYDGMRTYKEVRRVLCHELTHNVFGPHDDNFKTLNSKLNREVDEYEGAVKAGSHSLSGLGAGDYYDPDNTVGSALTDAEVTSRVLGGGTSSLLTGSREEMRQKMLEAATQRLRRQEQEIEERCGSDGPAALQ
ncbi:hypothetical protein FRB97_005721 [Tulasnella sp. 331]|nr:hypothetical protein FRB97_005721 [Tulasnella sp. 331]